VRFGPHGWLTVADGSHRTCRHQKREKPTGLSRGGSTRCPRGELDTQKWEPSHLLPPRGRRSAVRAASWTWSERSAPVGQRRSCVTRCEAHCARRLARGRGRGASFTTTPRQPLIGRRRTLPLHRRPCPRRASLSTLPCQEPRASTGRFSFSSGSANGWASCSDGEQHQTVRNEPHRYSTGVTQRHRMSTGSRAGITSGRSCVRPSHGVASGWPHAAMIRGCSSSGPRARTATARFRATRRTR
jgi:hypothetical protein